jgi:hemerythrin
LKSINTINDKKPISFFILIFVLIIYSALIAFTQHYERLSADSTIYLDIAKKYLSGDFADAINGYWGPLLSWLFIPFLYFLSSPVFAINALYLVVGLFTIVGVWILSYSFDITEKIRCAIIIALLPIMLFFSLVEIFDFLLVCFIVYYLSVIFKNDYPDKLYRGIFCGVLGALAYFSKSYAFPFFIVHFLIMNVLHFSRYSTKHEKRKVVRNAIMGFAVFAIISAPWIAAISMKYDRLTFSNTGKGNFAPIGPEDPKTGLERGVPIFHKGLFAPPNTTATSVWEDPSYIWKDVTSWSPLDSSAHFKYFITNIARNVFEALDIYESCSRLAIAIIVAYILLLIPGPFNKQMLRGDRLYSFLTVLVFSGGYLPFHLEHRYLWTINILLLLMGGHVLNVIFQNDFFNKKLRSNILIAIFALSFMISPLKSYAQAGKNNINKEMYNLSAYLRDHFKIQGNIASNREWEKIAIHDSWHKTFRLSYWLNSKYYGQTEAVISDEDLERELEKFGIDYYFVWGESQSIPQFLSKYRELTNNSYPDLKIYSLKETSN